jgi:hypothetical protein
VYFPTSRLRCEVTVRLGRPLGNPIAFCSLVLVVVVVNVRIFDTTDIVTMRYLRTMLRQNSSHDMMYIIFSHTRLY